MPFSIFTSRWPHTARIRKRLFISSLPICAACLITACAGVPAQSSSSLIAISEAPGQRTQATSFAANDYQHTATASAPQQSLTDTATASRTALDWSATIDADFEFAKTLVENELKVNLESTRLHVVNDSPINLEVAYETQRLVTEQFGHTAFAKHFLDQIMQPLAGTYAALFSARSNTILISRSMLHSYEASIADEEPASTKRAALLTLLIHELVHAADDQRHLIHDKRVFNFRASFAQSATFEGHAQWVTRRICEIANCSEGLHALDKFMFGNDNSDGRAANPGRAISRNVLEYSYVEGERFIEALASRDNGLELIDQVLDQPPQDPLQILAPETYPDVNREARNQQLIKASRSVGHSWATAPWKGIETSPLKGVDMRADETRRQAAIDGFTKLIKAMVSMQYYDQQQVDMPPFESTILEAESADTAVLFANMLHTNTQHFGTRINDEPLKIHITGTPADNMMPMHIYRTAIDKNISHRTTVAVSGKYVVQVSGQTQDQEPMDDYAIRVLLELTSNPAALAVKDTAIN